MEQLVTGKQFYDELEKENFSQIIKYCDAILNKEPNNVVALCNRAFAQLKLDLFRRVIKDCDAAMKLDPSCLRAHLMKGHALKALNKTQEAEKVWKEALQILGDIEIHLQIKRCLKGEPSPVVQQTTPVSITPSAPVTSHPSPTSNFVLMEEEANLTTGPLLAARGRIPSRPPENKGIQLATPDPIPLTLNTQESVSASAMVAARGLVQHGVGQREIDEKIALGYLQVNTGNFMKAIELFTSLLQKNPRIVAAYLGRGTAFALVGNLDQAIMDFTAAIQVSPNTVDAWKRRGQSRAAKGLDNEALSDLTRAAELEPTDGEIYHQRGLVYYKQKNYTRALIDFTTASNMDKMNKLSWNHRGLCFNAVGQPLDAVEAHARASAIDPTFKEAWANMAQAYKDFGDIEKSEQLFLKALAVDPNYFHSYHLRGIARFTAGNHRGALQDLTTALSINPSHDDSIHMRGVVKHGLGLFRESIKDYDTVIAVKPDHVAWYQKEVALYVIRKLDENLANFNIDVELDKNFKESWCKRHHPAILVHYEPQKLVNTPDVSLKDNLTNPDACQLLNLAKQIGPKCQLNSAGYLRNKRQHAAFGFAILECTQVLKSVWKEGKNQVSGSASSGTTFQHTFNWRDMYDVLVKWRQYSEPNDPVWWVDLLSPEQFQEGFGSHTPMLSGQTKVVRYYPMFKRSLEIMKKMMIKDLNLTPEMKGIVENAQDCKDLYNIMRRDFWIVTPCHSIARPGTILEGTRLTIQNSPPEGFEYSIRTPGTPPRWKEYEIEMNHIWDLLTKEVTKQEIDLDRVSDLILTLTFFWYNFMPLSRGTAAAGYMGLLSMFYAIDIEIEGFIPKEFQPDWEGILTPKVEDFIQALKVWMYPARKPTTILNNIPSVGTVFPTIRAMIEALNAATA